ncbi:MAG: hypothetical protein R3190_02175 [Thermoanaerobaculia bacterium]|nr:hypothetical protein [Thermoanaerobaculia bacterium]
MSSTASGPSGRRVLLATLGALLLAALILIGAVLPAEYGIDPLGVGSALGLTALARERPVTDEPEGYRTDSVDLVVRPSEWVEYSYRLEAGASLLFSWRASGTLTSNFHSAPDGAPPGFAESWDSRETDNAHGSYTAPFSGIHGWYWENRGDTEVRVRLDTSGFYAYAHEGRYRVSGYHAVEDLDGNELPTP